MALLVINDYLLMTPFLDNRQNIFVFWKLLFLNLNLQINIYNYVLRRITMAMIQWCHYVSVYMRSVTLTNFRISSYSWVLLMEQRTRSLWLLKICPSWNKYWKFPTKPKHLYHWEHSSSLVTISLPGKKVNSNIQIHGPRNWGRTFATMTLSWVCVLGVVG